MSEIPGVRAESPETVESVAESLFGSTPEYLAAHNTSDELRAMANQLRAEADEYEEAIVELEHTLRDKKTKKRIVHYKWQNHLEAAVIAKSMESAE